MKANPLEADEGKSIRQMLLLMLIELWNHLSILSQHKTRPPFPSFAKEKSKLGIYLPIPKL